MSTESSLFSIDPEIVTECERVDGCTNWLPQNKPRYVMGVGYPEDLLVSVALGADMFDCVWPTRTAVSSKSNLHHLFKVLSVTSDNLLF